MSSYVDSAFEEQSPTDVLFRSWRMIRILCRLDYANHESAAYQESYAVRIPLVFNRDMRKEKGGGWTHCLDLLIE